MESDKKMISLPEQRTELAVTAPLPVYFLGHGSPMNAISDTVFSRNWHKLGEQLQPKPAAILCISAHWLTQGLSAVTSAGTLQTIHDFGGFPQALFDVEYDVQGSQALVSAVKHCVNMVSISEDNQRGIDHGAWSVLVHMYPQADVPVVQLSIDYSQPASFHYQLGRQLRALRRLGILIIASGNLVHNLMRVAWDKLHEPVFGYDWAIEADAKMKKWLLEGRHQPLIDWDKQGNAFKLAIPTPDHYYPMLYALGIQEEHDELTVFNEAAVGGSLTMTSFRLDYRL
ncbi:4,5-DOPA dioxygenase extradiol [Acinetobacter sp.]|jgi:4,5-DOPA dioxygenase extradiol|uniref:4,5-DOPA-extradiol-dioxygenase n=1 Tax=Acinetobacter sp. TaxID=472 RepID=UPI0035B4B456